MSLKEVAVCEICHHKLNFDKVTVIELASCIIIYCSPWVSKTKFSNCPMVIVEQPSKPAKGLYDFNLRLIYSLRTIRKGMTAIKMLNGILNLPPPSHLYSEHEMYLGCVMENICKGVIKDAVEVLKTCNRNFSIAVDSSWQRRR